MKMKANFLHDENEKIAHLGSKGSKRGIHIRRKVTQAGKVRERDEKRMGY